MEMDPSSLPHRKPGEICTLEAKSSVKWTARNFAAAQLARLTTGHKRSERLQKVILSDNKLR